MPKKFDVREFEAFCRSKPAGERYHGVDTSKCALAQFGFQHIGRANRHHHGISEAVYRAAVFHGYGSDAPPDFYTFSALADRLSRVDS
jgi:hypothetical protein